MTLLEELRWRELVHNVTDENLNEILEKEQLTFYLGADPTGDSLHVGHLLVYLLAKRLHRKGHIPIFLIGGATGSIGDPKQTGERVMIDMDLLNRNADKLYEQVKSLFKCEMVNNYDWTKNIDVVSYLRDYGKYFNVNYMLSKDIVKSRLEQGISYAEFSYQILQALDFEHLYKNKNVTMQIGGQDQWGNIVGGMELIRKVHGSEAKAYGLTAPLVLKSDGTKFGKSESGTVWLDSKKTSIFEFYQFWINTSDSDVIRWLKQFTFLTKKEIDEIETEFLKQPELRLAQKILAKEVTKIVHGEQGVIKAINITNALFNNDLSNLTEDEIEILSKDFKKSNKVNLIDLIIDLELSKSKREARQFIESGAISINEEKVTDINYEISDSNLLFNKFAFIRKGKKNYGLFIKE